MYQKVLLPLDGTKKSEEVIPLIGQEIGPDTEVTLLQVLHPIKTQTIGGHVVLGSQREEAERIEALAYLRGVAGETGNLGRWNCDAVMAARASDGIVSYAERVGVEAIVMLVPERKGLMKLVKGNTCRGVQRNSSAEVRVFTAGDAQEGLHRDDVQSATGSTTSVSGRGSLAHPPKNGSDKAPALTATLDLPLLTTNLLRDVDLFVGLSIGQIDRVASLGERMAIPKGAALDKGGETGANLFIIIDGEAQLSAHSGVGEISVRVAGPGDSFPMAALLESGTLITSGEALTDMDVLAIPATSLIQLCSDDAEIGRNVYKAAAQLFAKRYSSTLAHLAASAERELRDTDRQWLK